MSSGIEPTTSSGKQPNLTKSRSFCNKYRIIETEIEPLSASNPTFIESNTKRRHKQNERTSVSSSTPTMSRNNIEMDDQQRRNLQDMANANLDIQQQRLRDQRNAALNISGLSNLGNNFPQVRPDDFNPAFNIAGFNADEAIRFIQSKCLLSNTIPPQRKQELLTLCNIARQRAALDNEAHTSILRELAVVSSGLLAGRAYSLHMANTIDAASLGLPAPPAPQVRYAQPRGGYRTATRPHGRGGRRPR